MVRHWESRIRSYAWPKKSSKLIFSKTKLPATTFFYTFSICILAKNHLVSADSCYIWRGTLHENCFLPVDNYDYFKRMLPRNIYTKLFAHREGNLVVKSVIKNYTFWILSAVLTVRLVSNVLCQNVPQCQE